MLKYSLKMLNFVLIMEQRRKLYAIINPYSGTHSKDAIPAALKRAIDPQRWQLKVGVIDRNSHLPQMAAEAIAENYDGVIAVGGDGTVKKQPKKVVKIGRNDLCPCGSGLKWKKCDCKQYHS